METVLLRMRTAALHRIEAAFLFFCLQIHWPDNKHANALLQKTKSILLENTKPSTMISTSTEEGSAVTYLLYVLTAYFCFQK